MGHRCSGLTLRATSFNLLCDHSVTLEGHPTGPTEEPRYPWSKGAMNCCYRLPGLHQVLLEGERRVRPTVGIKMMGTKAEGHLHWQHTSSGSLLIIS